MKLRYPSARAVLTAAAAVAAALWGVVLAINHLDGRGSLLDRIEAPLVDLRFLMAGPRPPPRNLVIVAIDDDTVREAGSYPLPRTLVAKLLEELAKRRPRAIAVDFLFIDPGAPEADQALGAALGKARAVIAAAGLFSDDSMDATRGSPLRRFAHVPVADRVIWPIDSLQDAAAVGLVNIATDHGGTPRHVPLLFRSGDTLLPSLTLRTAALASGEDPEIQDERLIIGQSVIQTDLGYNLPLRFYGPRGTIETISARQILQGDLADQAIRDRVVVIGSTALGTSDTFATPFDPVMPGVEVLATAIGHLISGDGLVRTGDTRRVDAGAALLLPVFTIVMMGLRRIGLGLAMASLLLVLWTTLTTIAFLHGYWLNMSVPLAAVVPSAMLFVAVRLWLDQHVERRLDAVQRALRPFHSPVLADALAARPDFLAEPVRQVTAVLFIDLSGFTAASERLGPERTRDFLKEFHSLIEDEVTRHGGLVVSYMGDGAMIVFGVPKAQSSDAREAVETAVGLVERVREWLGTRPADLAGPLDVRVGAHYGPVVVSRLGADTHQHITATGDCVNVASRLLEVAADNNALVAASADLLDAAQIGSGQNGSLFGEEQRIPIRGRSQPLVVRLWPKPPMGGSVSSGPPSG